MTEYQIQSPTRRCAAGDRELKPGEKFHSVLVDEAGRFARRDYAADAWPGPPPGAIAHWSGRVPTNADAHRRPPVDDEMLVECFQRLDGATEAPKVHFRYVVALLLMRRKRFKFEDVIKGSAGEALALRDARSGDRFQVVDPGLTEAQMAAVQDEVFQVLGWA